MGTARKDVVYLSGIGGNDLLCTTQIRSEVRIDDRLISLLFHVVPDCNISDPIIIGRDIFDLGLCVKIDNDNLVIYAKEQSNFCNKAVSLDFNQIDTDLEGRDKEMLISI
ncbi:unnamed protein product [Euphydryas editha]|uniref:Uncharacterized protein n=1 Tax=Euphydryas editha TaxID=104508 RepID=A0AAU9VAM8_EUPED|nr:unnamed protein product [Euphydryas editha]